MLARWPVKVLFIENHQVFAETVIRRVLAGHEVALVPTVAEAKGIMSQSFNVALVLHGVEGGYSSDGRLIRASLVNRPDPFLE